MNYREWFTNWFDAFHPSKNYWTRALGMAETVENSPWHREANVWVHTEMVVEEYLKLSPEVWSREDALGAIALAFHDTGKPKAQEVVTRPDGSTYNRFKGHEKISACLWRDYLTQFPHEFQDVGIVDGLFFPVAWMVEYHLPYDIKDSTKRANLALTLRRLDLVDVFPNVLRADARGRISDDHDIKLARVDEWIAAFEKVEAEETSHLGHKLVMFLIGASGSGKSTFTKREFPKSTVFSYDALRLEWYHDPSITDEKEQYAHCFKRSTEDAKFNERAMQAFNKLLADPLIDHIIVDNVNASAKSRRSLLAAARQKRWKTGAEIFVVPLHVLIERQTARGDKFLRSDIVENQFFSISVPCYGEFDFVTTITTS